MKKRIVVLAVVILILILLWLIYLYFRSREDDKQLTLFGNVDVRQVDIGFRVSGRVDQLFYQEGDLVSKGSKMATLDKTPYDSQLAQAEANLEAVKVTLTNAVTLMNRRNELIGIEGVSQEDLDNATTAMEQAKASVAQNEAAVQVAKDNLSYTEVWAPNDGVILTRVREPGSTVNLGEPVYTLSLSSPVWIRAFISEPDLGKICFGMDAEVFTDRRGGKSYHGKIGFISPLAEFTPKTVETRDLRTDLVYRLRIYVDDADQGLKQGMPVTVKLKLPCP